MRVWMIAVLAIIATFSAVLIMKVVAPFRAQAQGTQIEKVAEKTSEKAPVKAPEKLVTPVADAPALPSDVVPSIERAQARSQAKTDSGRSDPFAPVSAPSKANLAQPHNGVESLGSDPSAHTPPPPNFQVPPPPPGTLAQPADKDELDLSELPLPPEKPSLANKLELTALMDDKAIFRIPDEEFRRAQKLPRLISISKGESFETVTLEGVKDSTATLVEDGEHVEKTLSPIK